MIMKRIKCIILMFVMLFMSSVSVYAENNIVDFSRKGTIDITLSEEEDIKVSGAEITIYKVADAGVNNSNLEFVYDDDLSTCKEDLDKGNITNEVVTCVTSSDLVSYSGVTDEEGRVHFDNLDLGLYLVSQTNQVEGYSKVSPFTVMIPQVQGNSWIYEIEATPKVDIIRLFDLTVKKVWNVSSDVDIPNEVTVELFKGEEVVDKVTLNEENDWTYTFRQIEMSDDYSVREVSVDGYTATYREEGNTFIVTNTKSLVQTGRSIYVVPILALSGLFFIVVGIMLEKRKKYE